MPDPDALRLEVVLGSGACPPLVLAALGVTSCSPLHAMEVEEACTVAHDERTEPSLPRLARGMSSASPTLGMTTMCAPLLDGSVPHPQASTARNGLVLAVESPLSSPQLTLGRGLVGLDQLRVGGTAAPAAWCRVALKLGRAVKALLLCRCAVTLRTPAGVCWLLTNRWPSDAIIAVLAEADLPLRTIATEVMTPAWRFLTVMEAETHRSLARPPATSLLSPGGAPRLRASAAAPTESALAAESSVIQLTLGLLALDRASGRGASALVTSRRVIGVASAVGASLLLRSMHGPLMPSPEGG